MYMNLFYRYYLQATYCKEPAYSLTLTFTPSPLHPRSWITMETWHIYILDQPLLMSISLLLYVPTLNLPLKTFTALSTFPPTKSIYSIRHMTFLLNQYVFLQSENVIYESLPLPRYFSHISFSPYTWSIQSCCLLKPPYSSSIWYSVFWINLN